MVKPMKRLPQSPRKIRPPPRCRKLKRRKPRQAPHEGHEQEAHEQLAEHDGVEQQHPAGHEGDPRREPVHVVEEVEGVRDPHDPEHGDHDVHPLVGQERRAHVGQDHHQRGRDLAQGLHRGVEAVAQDVVAEAHREGEGGADAEGHDLALHPVGLRERGEPVAEGLREPRALADAAGRADSPRGPPGGRRRRPPLLRYAAWGRDGLCAGRAGPWPRGAGPGRGSRARGRWTRMKVAAITMRRSPAPPIQAANFSARSSR